MAATTAIVASVGSAVYSSYQASKRPSAPSLASLNPPSVASDQMKADAAGSAAATAQRKKTAATKGMGSTLVTSPVGITNLGTPPGKTLLGS